MNLRRMLHAILVILIAFTATAVPMAAQSSGTTRIRMLDSLAQQASSNSDPSELIQTLLKTSYSPLFSTIPANDPIVKQLVSLHAAMVPVQKSPISDNNIASAFDAWRYHIGMRNFPPTTNRDVHYYRLFLSRFAPNLLPRGKETGQVHWRITPAEAIYVLDLMIGSGGIPPDTNAYKGGNFTEGASGGSTNSPGTQEYWQDVSTFYTKTTPAQRKAELSDLFNKLGIMP